jgi:hypothetical protein
MICLVAIYWQCGKVMFSGVQYDLSCNYILTMWESYVLWCPIWSVVYLYIDNVGKLCSLGSSMICLVAIYWQCRKVMFSGVQYDLSCSYILTMWESYVLWCPIWSVVYLYIDNVGKLCSLVSSMICLVAIYWQCGKVMFSGVQYDLSCTYILTMWESYVLWCPVWSVL